MDNYDFERLVEGNFGTYILCLLAVGLIYFFLYRKIVLTFLDPFFIYVLSTVFAIADVCIMAVTGAIKPYYITSFFLTQIAFLGGFFIFRGFSEKRVKLPESTFTLKLSKRESIITCLIFFSLFLIVQLSIYYTRGIPLFFDSRLDYYNQGGGFGITARILGVLSIFVCFLIIQITFEHYKSLSWLSWLLLILMFVFYVLTQVLSGGKSAILTPLTILFSYLFINDRKADIKKIVKRYFIFIVGALLALVSVIILAQSADAGQPPPLLALLYRLIVSGDVYWYVYPNDVIKTYQIKANGFVWLFNDFLGLFRLISWSDLGLHPGVYFYNYHHPTDATRGPNIRHNVFGLMYFGYYGAIVYSFLLGVFLSIVRFLLVALRSNSIFFKFSVVYLFINSPMIEPDVTLFMLALNNLLLMLPLLIIIAYLIKAILQFDGKTNRLVHRHSVL